MNALEQAAAYANDAECPAIARVHILALLDVIANNNAFVRTGVGTYTFTPWGSDHKKQCASLTTMLLSDPPQPAPCNCGLITAQVVNESHSETRVDLFPGKPIVRPFDEAKEREMFEAEMLTSDWPAAQAAMRKRADGNNDMYHDSCANIQWQAWLTRARIAAEGG